MSVKAQREAALRVVFLEGRATGIESLAAALGKLFEDVLTVDERDLIGSYVRDVAKALLEKDKKALADARAVLP